MLTFKKFLEEGNPLAKVHGKAEEGGHMVAISATRPGKDNKARRKQLAADIRASGHGHRPAKGTWEGGEEDSFVVHARSSSSEDNRKLIHHARKWAEKYGQDSFLHHDGKKARLIGTNTTGFPGYGKREPVGNRIKYNNPDAPFQTEFKPRKPKDKRPKFTTG